VFMYEGLFIKYVMTICEFNEIDCDSGGRRYWGLCVGNAMIHSVCMSASSALKS
jgi:hypothetical protein